MSAPRSVGDQRVLRAVEPLARAAQRAGTSRCEPHRLDDRAVWLKCGPLHGRAGLRYGVLAALGVPPPRLREYANLRWLRASGFGAPEPLAAGVSRTGARLTFQFLATAAVEDARTLRAFSQQVDDAAQRHAVLAALGGEVARLHAAGFVHRDLFPRNLLVTREREAPRVHFLDCWRGGPGRARPLRGVAYDLGGLLLFAPELWSDDETAHLLDAYFARREALDARAERGRLLRAALRRRAALVDRLQARGRTDPPIPPRAWAPAELR